MVRLRFIFFTVLLQIVSLGLSAQQHSVSGVVVSDYRSLNNADGRFVDWNDCDVTESLRTVYICNEDGTGGLRLVFDNIYDNRLEKGDRVTLSLAKCSVAQGVVTGLKAGSVISRTPGKPLEPRRRSIASLCDSDLYTYVEIDSLEFADKAGAFLNVDERFVQKTPLNESQKPNSSIDSWANMLKSADGTYIYMIMSTRVPWRRDGNGVPKGVGPVAGILVPAQLPRYGNMHSRYALRPMCREDIRIPEAEASSYAVVASLRHDNNPGNNALYLYNGLQLNDKVCHIMSDRFVMEQGGGQIWTEAMAYLRADRDLDSPVVEHNGERKGGAFRFEGNLHGFYKYDDKGEVEGVNPINVAFSTKNLQKNGRLFFDFAWCSGNGSAKPSWGYPVDWTLEYSVDGGKSFYRASDMCFTPRPIAYPNADVAQYGKCRLCRDAAPGFTQHSVQLPSECIDKENVVVRLVPSAKIVSFSEDPSVPLENRLENMKRGKMHYIVIRFSSIEINYLGK